MFYTDVSPIFSEKAANSLTRPRRQPSSISLNMILYIYLTRFLKEKNLCLLESNVMEIPLETLSYRFLHFSVLLLI